MKIVCTNGMLIDGFSNLGHEVFPLQTTRGLADNTPLLSKITTLCPEPDLVFLEIWQERSLPPDLDSIPFPLAAWLVDSTINFYWAKHIAPLFDCVFVDQLASVQELAARGITATWLPFFARSEWFTPPTSPRQHLVSFTGRITPERPKRKNLVYLLQEHFPIYVAEEGENIREVLAASCITINENLFNGVNLRTFEATAAGALLFTEAKSHGVDQLFTPGKHIVLYEPHTLLSQLSTAVEAFKNNEGGEWVTLARQGQERCKAQHMSTNRAAQVLDTVFRQPADRQRRIWRKLGLAQAEYNLRLRYGGRLDGVREALKRVIHEEIDMTGGFQDIPGDPDSATTMQTPEQSAQYTLGLIDARHGNFDRALHYFTAAGNGILPQVMAALVLVYQGHHYAALTTLLPLLPSPAEAAQAGIPPPLPTDLPENLRRAHIFFMAAQILRNAGLVMSLGLAQAEQDPFPETALGLLKLAWGEAHDPIILDAMLACTDTVDRSGENLPLILSFIEEGLATDAQILHAAELAEKYYDKPQAARILRALRQAKVVSKMWGWT